MKTRVRYFLNEFLGNTSKERKKTFLILHTNHSTDRCHAKFASLFVFICLSHFVILLFLYLFLSTGFTYLCHFVILMFLYLFLSVCFSYLCPFVILLFLSPFLYICYLFSLSDKVILFLSIFLSTVPVLSIYFIYQSKSFCHSFVSIRLFVLSVLLIFCHSFVSLSFIYPFK